MRLLIVFIPFLLFLPKKDLDCLNCSDDNKFSVLVITETNGFKHKSINAGLYLIKQLGNENKFNVYSSNNSDSITAKNLENISSIIFLNTSGDILNLKQQEVMEEFIKEGKGFVGIHSATDTEYDWDWYGGLVGAYFKSHPIGTAKAKINTIISEHISTKHLEREWEIRDEWYNFYNINPNINILLNLDETSYMGGKHGQNHPITWFHEYSGGRSFYTGLGHLVGTYSDERFIDILRGGILYASGE